MPVLVDNQVGPQAHRAVPVGDLGRALGLVRLVPIILIFRNCPKCQRYDRFRPETGIRRKRPPMAGWPNFHQWCKFVLRNRGKRRRTSLILM